MWAALAVVVLAYWVVPEIIGHHAQAGAWVGSGAKNRLALTFDDGPGPDTEAVLDVLQDKGAHATFFVIAREAARFPAVMQRIVAEGHQVALHGVHHRSALLSAPWTTWREVAGGRAQVALLAGQPPRFYRPPWGHHNLATWLAPAAAGMRRVLWSIAPDDWRPDKSAEEIAQHVLRYALPGAVVVLHDAGGDRRRTVAALPAMIDGVRRLGLEPVTLSAMDEEHRWPKKIWTWWEGIFTRRYQVETVPAPDGGPPVLRVGRARYRGPALEAGGETVRPGAAMAEMHFQNYTLGQGSGDGAGALRAWVRVAGSLPALGGLVASRPALADARLVGGVTVLDVGRAVERLGFHRQEMGGLSMLPMRLYLILLMAIFHRQGLGVLRRLARLKPVLIYMPRQEFLARYGPKED